MAPILKIQCPKCSGKLKITPQDGPSKVRCPACKATIKVPPLSELKAEPEADDYGDWADESAEAEDDSYAASGSDSEWDSTDPNSEWDDGDDEYATDEYDEYVPARRRRKPANRRKGPAKKSTSKKTQSNDGGSRKTSVVIVGAVFGVSMVGALIYFTVSGPADENDVAAPVGQAGVEAPGVGGAGTTTVDPDGEGEPVRSQVEIAASARQYVREQASLIDAPLRGTWGNTAVEIRRSWDLAADPLPEQDYSALVELSTKNAGISFGLMNDEHEWCSLSRPELGQNSILVDRKSWTGRQLQGQPGSMSSAAEVGYVYGGGMSDDGTLVGRELRVNRSRLDWNEHWVTIHKYDNTLVKVIPGAKSIRFLAGNRILLATDDIADS